MIINWLFEVGASIIHGILYLVPSWSIADSILDQARSVGNVVGSMDNWFPINFIVGCLLLLLAVRLWFLVWNGIQWLYHLVPFNG